MRIRPESILFILFLSSLGGLTPLSIDMGLPALHAIGASLHADPALASLTLSLFLIGFSFGPMVLGPMSDRFGRRPVLLGGCTLFAISGIGCAIATSLPTLLFWRLLQGIGAGAGSTLSMAIIRDLFDGALARQRLSYIATVGSVAPMIAPTLGALVLGAFGWRAIYGSLAVAGVLLLIAVCVGFSESHGKIDKTALQPKRLLANYARIFQNRISLGYILVASLHFGCIFSYVSSSPLVMMGVLKVSPTNYGWTFAATALGIMFGAYLNGQLAVKGFSATSLMTFGLSLSSLSALGLVWASYSNAPSLPVILSLLVINTFCLGLIGPNATQGVMHPMPDIAGVASAVLGSARMLVGSLAGFVVAALFDSRTVHAMALSMTFFSVSALFTYWWIVRGATEERVISPPVLPPG